MSLQDPPVSLQDPPCLCHVSSRSQELKAWFSWPRPTVRQGKSHLWVIDHQLALQEYWATQDKQLRWRHPCERHPLLIWKNLRCHLAAPLRLYQTVSLKTCHVLKKQTDEVDIYHNHMEESVCWLLEIFPSKPQSSVGLQGVSFNFIGNSFTSSRCHPPPHFCSYYRHTPRQGPSLVKVNRYRLVTRSSPHSSHWW